MTEAVLRGEPAEATPLRVLMSAPARAALGARVAAEIAASGRTAVFAELGEDAELAFVSREVTGKSTKHEVLPHTRRFYDALLAAPSLRWVQAHSAGADRPVYVELRRRGVSVATASGTNATIVAHTALAGVLALARGLPTLIEAQREHRWAPWIGGTLPRDLQGQAATIVGWGPIGQRLGALLVALGMNLNVVRGNDAPATWTDSGRIDGAGILATVPFERIAEVLPQSDWLILACPLTDRTRGLIDAAALASLPAGAHFINVARGEIVDESALIEVLSAGKLAGAFLDVFTHEPLARESPLWSLPNVLVSPHAAGHSDGNEARVADFFVDNLRRWLRRAPLLSVVA